MAVAGIGTEIVECLRIAQMIEQHGEAFLTRVFTQQEIAYCSARNAATQHYAGGWAAKEAVLKAIGTSWRRGINWRDVEVLYSPSGKTTIALTGGAGEAAAVKGIDSVMISIANCRTHATAYALAMGLPPDA